MAIMKKLLILLLFIPYLGFSQIKISALTEATTLNANDWFMAVQGGTTKKVAFYRFSYNQDSTALQIEDSLAFYVQKTELSDSLLNYILRTELNDSLANYTSLDSLTYYMKTIDVRNAISDSIAGISSVSLGTSYQVPFVNSTGTDLAYSDNFKYDGKTLTIVSDSGYSNINIGLDAGFSETINSQNNIFIGEGVGYDNSSGDFNTVIGNSSFNDNVTGNHNTIIGYYAGRSRNNSFNNSLILGYFAGSLENAPGDSNVFIGPFSGNLETGSNKLYIENSNSATPLIYGEFDNNLVRINGTLDFSEEPNMPKIYSQATEPDIPNNTTAFWVDTDDSKYYIILDIGGTQKKLELL